MRQALHYPPPSDEQREERNTTSINTLITMKVGLEVEKPCQTLWLMVESQPQPEKKEPPRLKDFEIF